MNAFELSLIMSISAFLYIVYVVLQYNPINKDTTDAK
jgi:hypothetical protein